MIRNRIMLKSVGKLLANANGNEHFLKNIITRDETWVYGYDVETKMQSSHWMVKGPLNEKKHG